jgi:2-hydroxy-3-keto-5-methylthiopentenyl-1-phosphate phosphatase
MRDASIPIRATVIDFDGTICPQDVSEEILQEFASPAWKDIDLEFQRGEIGSRECLVRQAALLSGTRDAMLVFALERFTLEPSFRPFVEWARALEVDVVVASDGLGFYVEPMLRGAGIEGVSIYTNDTALEDGQPPRFSFSNAHPICVGCGTCKMLVVQKSRERSAGPVAFVGEGHSDRYGALYADLVFAKKHLVDICKQDGITFSAWETFDDVRLGMEEARDLPGPVGPEVCPGWTWPSRAGLDRR